jgi:TolB protein
MNICLNKKKPWIFKILFLNLILYAFACDETIVEPQIDANKIFFISNRDGNSDTIFTNYLNNDVFVMDPDGKNQINLTNSPDSDFIDIVLSGNGKKILYRYIKSGASPYFIMDINGMHKKIITSIYHQNFDASFSPDKQQIVYVSQNPNNDIIIMDINGNEQINLTSGTGVEGVHPKFSSDGRWICFCGYSNGFMPNNLFIIDKYGTNMKKLTNDTLDCYNNLFSLDNRKIFYTGFQNNGTEIFSINVDGTNVKKITNKNFQFIPMYLELSPDGKKILFTQFYSYNPTNSDLYLLEVDGTNLEQITFSNMAWRGVFTKNGKKIIYNERVNGISQIYEMNLDGTHKINLSNNEFDDEHPIPNY